MRLMIRLLLPLVFLVLSVAAQAQGTWSAVSQVSVTGMSHGFMAYQILRLNYTGTGTKTPVLVYEHQNAAGNICYQSGGTASPACSQLTGSIAAGGTGVNDWFNTAAFQSGYCANGCLVVSVAADQTSDVSGLTSNWGGYQDTPGSEPNERGVIAVVQTILSTFNADPTRVYVTGDSTGGIGAQAICLDYGAKTGSQGQQIAGCLPFGGAIFRGGITSPTNPQLAQIQGGPFQFNVSGANDVATSSNPTLWNEPVFRAITGLTNYPPGPLGGRAGSSPFFLLVDTGLSHDVWTTYRPLPAGKPLLDLLFLQTTASAGSGALTGTPRAALPSGFLHTVGAQVVDGSGNNVRLSCSNYEHPTASPAADMTAMRTQGFNCARVPFFDNILCPGGVCNFAGADATVAAATVAGMKIIFYHMGNEGVNGTGFCTVFQGNGLWYDSNGAAPWTGTNNTDGCGTTGTVTYARFKANWMAIAQHYAGNSTVIGADLHHEPSNFGNQSCCGGGIGAGTGTGQFRIQGGQLIDPNGNTFVPHGVNVGFDELTPASQTSDCRPLRDLFPKINHVRLSVNSNDNAGTASSSYPPPSFYANFIAQCTPFGIVVEIEDHNCNGGAWDTYVPGPLSGQVCAPETGGALQTTVNWYVALANQFKSNPYVWFGTLNEPNSTDGTYQQSSIRPISDYHVAIYNAVRGTGSNAVIQFMAGLGGSNDGTIGSNAGFNVAAYATMHNIMWEIHSYFGSDGNPGTTAQALDQLIGSTGACCGGSGGRGASAAQTIFSGDGLVPVIVGEFGSGECCGGQTSFASTNAITAAIIQGGFGADPWQFGHGGGGGWDIVNEGTNPFSLTSGWGINVGNFINANSSTPAPPPTGGVPGAVWGGAGGGDMRAMVIDVGGAITSADPGMLVIAEGIINNGALFNGAARGSASYPVTGGNWSDLSTVHSNPVTCCAGQLVFSVHDFPQSVIGSAPDSGPSATTIRNTTWGYLVTGNFNPVLVVGGASLDGTNGATNLLDEESWAQGLTQYVNGQLGGNGGPTFSGCQEPVSFDWQTFGNRAGDGIDGTLNPDGTNRVGQANFWQTLLYTKCNTVAPAVSVTFNPLDLAAITLTSANLVATVVDKTGAGQAVRVNVSQPSGKFCGEIAATAIGANWTAGIANGSFVLNSPSGLGSDLNGIGIDPNSGGGLQGIFFNNVLLSSGAVSSVNGEAITLCADLDAKLFWASSAAMRGAGNGWNNSPTASPAAGTGGLSFTGMTGPYFLIFNSLDGNVGTATLNAAGPFATGTPAGFLPWQTGVSTGTGHPTLLIFGDNDAPPNYANDNRMMAFATPVDLTQ